MMAGCVPRGSPKMGWKWGGRQNGRVLQLGASRPGYCPPTQAPSQSSCVPTPPLNRKVSPAPLNFLSVTQISAPNVVNIGKSEATPGHLTSRCVNQSHAKTSVRMFRAAALTAPKGNEPSQARRISCTPSRGWPMTLGACMDLKGIRWHHCDILNLT